MHTGTGQVAEIYLDGSARIKCPPNLVPAPGQYLLAHAQGSDSPLAVPLFLYNSAPDGFHAAPPEASIWTMGTRLDLRGPLGHGFSLPASVRKIVLITLDDAHLGLRGLMSAALDRKMEVALLSDFLVRGLPEIVEVQPLAAITEICKWADFIAAEAAREDLDQFKGMVEELGQLPTTQETQILVRTPMPCGGLADCGVCAVKTGYGWKMACKDGPVFNLNEFLIQ